MDATTGKITVDTSLPGKLVAGGVTEKDAGWGDPSKKLLKKDGSPDPFSLVSAPPTYSDWGGLTFGPHPCQTTAVGEAHVAKMQALKGAQRVSLMQQVFPPVVPHVDDAGPTPPLPPHRSEWAKALDPDRELRFFGETELLRATRNWARSQGISPWSSCGAMITQVLDHVGPHVVIPPIVGGKLGSLNTLVGHVGFTADGKGTSPRIEVRLGGTEEPIGAPPKITPGSGAAYADIFVDCVTDDLKQKHMLIKCASARLVYTEVTQFSVIKNRSGDAINGELLKLYPGEGLGSKTKGDPAYTKDHEYRASTEMLIQPALSGSVTGTVDAASGLTGRFAWTSAGSTSEEPSEEEKAAAKSKIIEEDSGAIDMSEYDDDDFATTMEPFILYLHPLFGTTPYNAAGYVIAPDHHRVLVSKKVCELMKVTRRARTWDEDAEDRDSHAMLTTLKVAVALAVMHGAYLITPYWWNLAVIFMQMSDAARQVAAEGATQAVRAEARADGETAAERRDAESEHLKTLKAERVELLRKKIMDRALQWVSAKPVKHELGWTITEMCASLNSFMNPTGKKTPKTTAEDVRACVDSLVEEGKLTLIPDSRFDIKGNAVATFLPTVAIGAGAA
ncbi:hypothetical protein AXK60_02130 [Tsukamurella pseudospumae]|uniref:Uncharacterized protein n=1 Tax=Tsukamurella pseudospumae TaxID=239498 RepID=A0A138AWC7_9ACTN|nr:hypothetical protein AXK60_02130 [Tsukamurella pseudospumae]